MAVLPQKLTNEYRDDAGVTHAATEVINGITYQVVYLPGNADSARSKALIAECNQNKSGNYRYVLQDNWDLPGKKTSWLFLRGQAIILDLNGFIINSTNAANGANYLETDAPLMEITDSSAAGTGSIDQFVLEPAVQIVTFSGNGAYCAECVRNADNPIHVIVRGGRRITFSNWEYTPAGVTWTVAPYWGFSFNNNATWYLSSKEAYAVSTTPYAAGVYNYAYGYAWELTAAQLYNLEIPTDHTYYLWARDKNGWYYYLDLRYTDGAWR